MRRSAAVVTFSPTTFDSRVRRVIQALSDGGYDVTLIVPAGDPDVPGAKATLVLPSAESTRASMIAQLARMAPSAILPTLAQSLHRNFAGYQKVVQHLLDTRPEIIHANDWITLPAAIEVAKKTGAKVVYDTHEFATAEHVDRSWWRLLARPHIRAIEGQLIGEADHVVTVSNGLANELRSLYGNRIKGLDVVRNLPTILLPKTEPRRNSSSDIRLVYVGLIRLERRIDVMIEALALLDSRFSLSVTGFGTSTYINTLKSLAAARGVADRVYWQPPVAPEMVVTALQQNDIGLFLSDGNHAQQQFALPNKLFEYIAAGLAVVSAGSQDVEEVVSKYRNGVFLPIATPQNLAQTLEGLEQSQLQKWKANSVQASGELNWDREKLILLEIYRKLLDSSRT